MFFCEYCEFFKNTHFEKHLRTADSVKVSGLLFIVRNENDFISKIIIFSKSGCFRDIETLCYINKKKNLEKCFVLERVFRFLFELNCN